MRSIETHFLSYKPLFLEAFLERRSKVARLVSRAAYRRLGAINRRATKAWYDGETCEA